MVISCAEMLSLFEQDSSAILKDSRYLDSTHQQCWSFNATWILSVKNCDDLRLLRQRSSETLTTCRPLENDRPKLWQLAVALILLVKNCDSFPQLWFCLSKIATTSRNIDSACQKLWRVYYFYQKTRKKKRHKKAEKFSLFCSAIPKEPLPKDHAWSLRS